MPRLTLPPQQCALLHVLDTLSGKWPILIMGTLLEGPRRFNELRRITGASQKMLAQALRVLERDGLLDRTVVPTVPIAVVYTATPLGETLAEAIKPLWIWSDTHIDAVLAARGAVETGGSAPKTESMVSLRRVVF